MLYGANKRLFITSGKVLHRTDKQQIHFVHLAENECVTLHRKDDTKWQNCDTKSVALD